MQNKSAPRAALQLVFALYAIGTLSSCLVADQFRYNSPEQTIHQVYTSPDCDIVQGAFARNDLEDKLVCSRITDKYKVISKRYISADELVRVEPFPQIAYDDVQMIVKHTPDHIAKRDKYKWYVLRYIMGSWRIISHGEYVYWSGLAIEKSTWWKALPCEVGAGYRIASDKENRLSAKKIGNIGINDDISDAFTQFVIAESSRDAKAVKEIFPTIPDDLLEHIKDNDPIYDYDITILNSEELYLPNHTVRICYQVEYIPNYKYYIIFEKDSLEWKVVFLNLVQHTQ